MQRGVPHTSSPPPRPNRIPNQTSIRTPQVVLKRVRACDPRQSSIDRLPKPVTGRILKSDKPHWSSSVLVTAADRVSLYDTGAPLFIEAGPDGTSVF